MGTRTSRSSPGTGVSLNTDFILRPLSAQDEPFLREMLYQAVFTPHGQPRPDPGIVDEPHLAKYVMGWGRPQDMGWAAVRMNAGRMNAGRINAGRINAEGKTMRSSGEVLAGAAWLRLLTGEQRGYGWVDDRIPEISIALLPAFRGHGLGTALLEKTLATAREHFSAVSLSVSKENPAARLYRRLGFAVVREDENELVMLRTFSQDGWRAAGPGGG